MAPSMPDAPRMATRVLRITLSSPAELPDVPMAGVVSDVIGLRLFERTRGKEDEMCVRGQRHVAVGVAARNEEQRRLLRREDVAEDLIRFRGLVPVVDSDGADQRRTLHGHHVLGFAPMRLPCPDATSAVARYDVESLHAFKLEVVDEGNLPAFIDGETAVDETRSLEQTHCLFPASRRPGAVRKTLS